MRDLFVKRVHSPAGYVAWEAAGLRWLAGADAVATAQVHSVEPEQLVLKRIHISPPTSSDAEALGRDLARMHAAGAGAYGVGPEGWTGDGWLGPSDDLLTLPLRPFATWGQMYADARLLPTVEAGIARGRLTLDDRVLIERIADRLGAGIFDTDDPPSRLHGDLWSGNLLWSDCGAVLIDPAAHGGHRETDLGMLTLFGAPYLERVLAAYDEAAPLAAGWRERVGLHQLHPLLVHATLFGGAYVTQARETARRYA